MCQASASHACCAVQPIGHLVFLSTQAIRRFGNAPKFFVTGVKDLGTGVKYMGSKVYFIFYILYMVLLMKVRLPGIEVIIIIIIIIIIIHVCTGDLPATTVDVMGGPVIIKY